jgi:hypothetical protein
VLTPPGRPHAITPALTMTTMPLRGPTRRHGKGGRCTPLPSLAKVSVREMARGGAPRLLRATTRVPTSPRHHPCPYYDDESSCSIEPGGSALSERVLTPARTAPRLLRATTRVPTPPICRSCPYYDSESAYSSESVLTPARATTRVPPSPRHHPCPYYDSESACSMVCADPGQDGPTPPQGNHKGPRIPSPPPLPLQ